MREYARVASLEHEREKPPPPPLRAVGNYVLITPAKHEERVGSVYLPQQSKERAMRYEGTVVSVKPTERTLTHGDVHSVPEPYRNAKGGVVECTLSVGDRVLYYGFDAKRCYLQDGSEVHAVPYEAILGVFE